MQSANVQTMPCPYGGPGTVILKQNKDGKVVGKCSLASSIARSHLPFGFRKPLKEAGCPKCPKSKNSRCQYASTKWTRV